MNTDRQTSGRIIHRVNSSDENTLIFKIIKFRYNTETLTTPFRVFEAEGSLCAKNQLYPFSRVNAILACNGRRTKTGSQHIPRYKYLLHVRRAVK